MPEWAKETFVNVFKRLGRKVLWKWESDSMSNNTDGLIMTKRWLPQQDILGHENVEVFISHGGLLGLEESLYHEVPVLIMPGLGDQYANGKRAQIDGYGEVVNWTELSEEKL